MPPSAARRSTPPGNGASGEMAAMHEICVGFDSYLSRNARDDMPRPTHDCAFAAASAGIFVGTPSSRLATMGVPATSTTMTASGLKPRLRRSASTAFVSPSANASVMLLREEVAEEQPRRAARSSMASALRRADDNLVGLCTPFRYLSGAISYVSWEKTLLKGYSTTPAHSLPLDLYIGARSQSSRRPHERRRRRLPHTSYLVLRGGSLAPPHLSPRRT